MAAAAVSVFAEYTKATLPTRAAVTHAALEWWASSGFDDKALDSPDAAGRVHLSGKIHDEMLKQAISRRGHSDYLPLNMLIDAGSLTLGETDLTVLSNMAIDMVQAFFQQIFTDRKAFIYSPTREKVPEGRAQILATAADPPTEEKAAGVLLILREVALQADASAMRTMSTKMATIVSRIVERVEDDDDAKAQRSAYDEQIRLLQGHIRGIDGFHEVELSTVEQVTKEPPPVQPQEVARLREELRKKEAELLREKKDSAEAKRREGEATGQRNNLNNALLSAVTKLGVEEENRPLLKHLVKEIGTKAHGRLQRLVGKW